MSVKRGGVNSFNPTTSMQHNDSLGMTEHLAEISVDGMNYMQDRGN